MKKTILTILITAIICITGTATATYVYTARDISYTPQDENWSVTNANEALTSLRDDLNNINNTGLKSKFVDYEMVYGKVSDTFTIVTIPKTSNTITRSTITSDNSENSSYTYTFDPISNDTYFYVIRASYNDSNSSTPFTIDNISVINGTVEQVGEGYTVTVPQVAYGDRYSSYSLFRVKGSENCKVTIPSTRATNGVKLVEFTL